MSQDLEDEGVSHEVEAEEYTEVEENAEVEEPSTVKKPSSPSSHFAEGHPHELEHQTEPEAEVEIEEAHLDESIGYDAPADPPHEDTNVSSPHPAPAEEDQEAHTEEAIEPAVEPAGNDIDHIVNLLETAPAVPVSKPRPMSVAIIPDDAPDIPDEE